MLLPWPNGVGSVVGLWVPVSEASCLAELSSGWTEDRGRTPPHPLQSWRSLGCSSPPLPPSLFLQDLRPPDGGAQLLNTVNDPRWLWVLCLQGPMNPAPESVCPMSVLLQSLNFDGQGCNFLCCLSQ